MLQRSVVQAAAILAAMTACLLAAPLDADAAVVAGVAPATPTGTDSAVNPPPVHPGPTFFIEQTPPSAVTIDAVTTPSSWKNALTLHIHNGGLSTGRVITIRSHVAVGAFAPELNADAWVGWRERVLIDDWEWVDGGAYALASTPLLLPGSQHVVNSSGDTIDITFDALATGADFFLIKQLRYTGPTIAPGDQMHTFIDIIANPLVPEPATSAALAIVSAALLFRRR